MVFALVEGLRVVKRENEVHQRFPVYFLSRSMYSDINFDKNISLREGLEKKCY